MKNTTMRKLAGIAAIVTLASCMMAPMGMTAFAAGETYTITIDNAADGHTYEAYQLFTGELAGGKLSNIVWGEDIDGTAVVAALQADATLNAVDAIKNLKSTADAATVAEALAGLTDKSAEAKALATVFESLVDGTPTKSSTDAGDTYTISELPAGYYLVKDQDASLTGDHDAYTGYILEVVDSVEVAPKSAYPTVDKQVQDETADAEANADTNGWGETADHAINESFQFKLIANIAADEDLAYYDSYKVVFTDTMSTGVTFESIESVTVGSTTLTAEQYSCTATAGMEGNGTASWTLTIDDIMLYDTNLVDGAVVTVIYNAHLNSDAEITKEDGATSNANTVGLQYSNNPNWEAENEGDEEELGKTEPDTVWVFTYGVDNTKYKDSIADTNKLEGAGFTLYTDAAKTQAVNLVLEDGVYRPAAATEAEGVVIVTEMTSQADGTFNIVGLDVGTYYLAETKTPAGYNTCADTTIVIGASHSESGDGTTNTVELKANSTNLANNIINKSGSTLPSTGGIGTTLFYVIGGTMAAGAGVYLISKKRMNKED